MSQRRRAQFGLLAACLFLVTTIAILWIGNRDGMANPRGRQGAVVQVAPVHELKVVTMGK